MHTTAQPLLVNTKHHQGDAYAAIAVQVQSTIVAATVKITPAAIE
jgi:hypothetical protein